VAVHLLHRAKHGALRAVEPRPPMGLAWTEALAVGNTGFLERIRPWILSRQETELVLGGDGVWVLQESAVPYSSKTGSKNAGKPLN
jgi:hypothetical protein